MDFQKILNVMMKPAYIFDGRKILDHEKLAKLGFIVQTIGKKIQRPTQSRIWGTAKHN